MTLSAADVLHALLTENYFPAQKEKRDELPPIFSSAKFTPAVAQAIFSVAYPAPTSGKPNKTIPLRKEGYDQVDYRLTRYNNIFRLINIPHPKAYVHLCYSIHDHWNHIEKICTNFSSSIRPKKHRDGRLIIMDYEGFKTRKHKELNAAFGKHFMVHTDISSFYPSIYSHSIPWAAVGIQQAKRNHDNSLWYNQLDAMIRANKRNETNGVAIGPATSNIIADYLLFDIDESLKKEGYNFVRFIDDYKCYCASYGEAEKFIIDLSEKLLSLKLNLNLKKTHIMPLPSNQSDSWVSDLSTRMPKSKKLNLYEVFSFIDYAIDIHRTASDGSVLKFAINSVVKKIEKNTRSILELKKRLLELSFHYPALLPSLRYIDDNIYDKLAKDFKLKELSYTEIELNKLICENARYKRSDAMTWGLYFLQKQNLKPDDATIQNILETNDCIAITTLLNYKQRKNGKVAKYIINLVNNCCDDHSKDQYWLLFYEAFFRNLIPNPYVNDSTFDVLKNNNVSFLSSVEC